MFFQQWKMHNKCQRNIEGYSATSTLISTTANSEISGFKPANSHSLLNGVSSFLKSIPSTSSAIQEVSEQEEAEMEDIEPVDDIVDQDVQDEPVEKSKDKEFDPDLHCGVWDADEESQCLQALKTCSKHR